MKQVIKRNGELEEFTRVKPIRAILKASVAENEFNFADMAEAIVDDIEKAYDDLGVDELSVESIQDLIEVDLYSIANSPKIAKSYITYRYKRQAARDYETSLFKELDEKYRATNVQNQNANVDEVSFGGRKGEADSVAAKRMALDYMLSDMAKSNHINNRIYIHDLDNYVVGCHNCLSVPFDDLLKNGFNTRQTDIRPANSVNTAFQLVAVLFQLQSLQQFGGVSATHLDWTMVPYVRKSFFKHYKDGMLYVTKHTQDDIDKFTAFDAADISIENTEKYFDEAARQYALDMLQREVNQAVEGMYHNLNTLQSRSGNQLPFTSINYGTCTLAEGRMITKALLDKSLAGVGKLHKTPIFPCGIFQYWDKVNGKPGTPNYDLFRLALKSTGYRLYPNYANINWSGNAGWDENDPCTYFSTMGCRTANGFDINGLGQRKDGRGNICPVTIILPTLAAEAINEFDNTYDDNIVELFMKKLDQAIDDSKEMLLERFEWICSQPAASARFMYENNTMAGYIPEEGIRSALKHGTLALG